MSNYAHKDVASRMPHLLAAVKVESGPTTFQRANSVARLTELFAKSPDIAPDAVQVLDIVLLSPQELRALFVEGKGMGGWPKIIAELDTQRPFEET
ncbi:hypothetical protein OC842_007842 [Tilletia horrida]|uniref:Uncharacterized protein n=1 Tax=Tilletia horrida TaxID=155126 RepID=A0AAN6G347_9BASI|nr:hypothetical protein OC842_007842 [Tilletia horrida]